jgi:hypothetical protein
MLSYLMDEWFAMFEPLRLMPPIVPEMSDVKINVSYLHNCLISLIVFVAYFFLAIVMMMYEGPFEPSPMAVVYP